LASGAGTAAGASGAIGVAGVAGVAGSAGAGVVTSGKEGVLPSGAAQVTPRHIKTVTAAKNPFFRTHIVSSPFYLNFHIQDNLIPLSFKLKLSPSMAIVNYFSNRCY
jgi:hypothetical protein